MDEKRGGLEEEEDATGTRYWGGGELVRLTGRELKESRSSMGSMVMLGWRGTGRPVYLGVEKRCRED